MQLLDLKMAAQILEFSKTIQCDIVRRSVQVRLINGEKRADDAAAYLNISNKYGLFELEVGNFLIFVSKKLNKFWKKNCQTLAKLP